MTRDPDGPEADRATALSDDGRRRLELRASELEARLASLRQQVQEGAGDPDTREAHTRAAKELDEVRRALAGAASLEELPDDPSIVLMGDTVVIRLEDGTEEQYVIAAAVEASVADDRISAESPLARALLGRPVGAEVEVRVHGAGAYRCTVVRAARA
jgi:transcription elongation GreA/GreB family factor